MGGEGGREGQGVLTSYLELFQLLLVLKMQPIIIIIIGDYLADHEIKFA